MTTVPTIAESIERIKCEVLTDIMAGRVPASVSSFSELHDYRDANCYGGFCTDELADAMIDYYGGLDHNEEFPDKMMEHLNASQNGVDAWLQAGEHRKYKLFCVRADQIKAGDKLKRADFFVPVLKVATVKHELLPDRVIQITHHCANICFVPQHNLCILRAE